MKYGILTYHNIPNIGATLQAYALCRAMRELGAECEIIDYECENIVKRELTFIKNKGYLKNILKKIFVWEKQKRKIKECRNFVSYMYSNEKYNKNNICSANHIYDAFVSGSDMIWNLRISGYDFTYFLDFADEKKYRFSYASSVGEDWDVKNLGIIKELLLKYKKISTRESDTCEFIKKSFDIECKCVSDPTMLIPPGEWRKFVGPVKEKNYVFVYFGDGGALENALKYAKKHKKKVVFCCFGKPSATYKNAAIYSPAEWLGYIAGADAVFTSSYHGLLFSLYFEKPVWCFNKCSRTEKLLEVLGISNVLYEDEISFKNIVDYSICNRKIQQMREDSLQYLSEIIK